MEDIVLTIPLDDGKFQIEADSLDYANQWSGFKSIRQWKMETYMLVQAIGPWLYNSSAKSNQLQYNMSLHQLSD